MLASVTPDAPPSMSVTAERSQLILLNRESTPWEKKKEKKGLIILDPHVQAQSLPVHGCLCPDCLCTDLPFETSTQNVCQDLHYLALGKLRFWLVAVFAYVTSYTTSLFKNIFTLSRPHLLERRTATTPGTSRPTLFEYCVGSLTFHVEILNMEGTLRRGLRFIVLIREDLKV